MRPESLWEIEFRIEQPMTSLPVPWEVTEEVQYSPLYRWDGEKRKRKRGGQFQFTLMGEGVFKDASGIHRVGPGTGFLNKPYEPGTSYYYPEDGTEPWRFIWISFYGITAELIMDELIKRHGHVYQLPIEHASICRLLNYRHCSSREQILSPIDGCRMVMDLLTALGESAERNLFEAPGANLIRRAREIVMVNNTISVKAVAKELQVSREFLSRTFKKETGQTLQHFISGQKLEVATRLLKETSFTVEEVAARSGFKYFSTFTRSFKTHTGMTPTVFRNSGVVGRKANDD